MADKQIALEFALARADAWVANPSVRPVPKVSREVCSVLANEVRRLQDIVQRARDEAELVEHYGKPALVAVFDDKKPPTQITFEQ